MRGARCETIRRIPSGVGEAGDGNEQLRSVEKTLLPPASPTLLPPLASDLLLIGRATDAKMPGTLEASRVESAIHLKVRGASTGRANRSQPPARRKSHQAQPGKRRPSLRLGDWYGMRTVKQCLLTRIHLKQ